MTYVSTAISDNDYTVARYLVSSLLCYVQFKVQIDFQMYNILTSESVYSTAIVFVPTLQLWIMWPYKYITAKHISSEIGD